MSSAAEKERIATDTVVPAEVAAVSVPPKVGDRPPKDEAGTLDFPNPSGRSWTRQDAGDKKPRERVGRPAGSRNKGMTKAELAKLEKQLVRGHVTLAILTGQFVDEYTGMLLLEEAEANVRAILAVAEKHPGILEALQTMEEYSPYGYAIYQGSKISICLMARTGFLPRFFAKLAGHPLPLAEGEIEEPETELEARLASLLGEDE